MVAALSGIGRIGFEGGNDRGAKPLVFVYPSAIHDGESVEEVENGRMKFVTANKPPIITKFRFDQLVVGDCEYNGGLADPACANENNWRAILDSSEGLWTILSRPRNNLGGGGGSPDHVPHHSHISMPRGFIRGNHKHVLCEVQSQ